MRPADGGWLVRRTDKRGDVVPDSARTFGAEPEALAHVLASLRGEAADRRAADLVARAEAHVAERGLSVPPVE